MRCVCFFVLTFSLFVSKFAFALNCYAVIDGKDETSENVPVDNVIIPESSADGEIIWKSKQYTRDIKCNNAYVDEYVYFYPFPKVDMSSIPSGMTFGIIYNGNSYDLSSSSSSKIQTDIFVKRFTTQNGVINVQVYIKKNGSISGGFNGSLPIYQLDGVGGLNSSTEAKNFRFSVSNLSNIATGNCSYSLNGISSSNNITVNDNLISNGQRISSVGSASVSCTPVDLLKNRTAHMDLYTTDSSGSHLFNTDRDGLSYQLMMSGGSITPSTTSGSPLTVGFNLDNNARGSLNFDQIIFLTSSDEDWLYQQNSITATSKNPNLKMKVSSFE